MGTLDLDLGSSRQGELPLPIIDDFGSLFLRWLIHLCKFTGVIRIERLYIGLLLPSQHRILMRLLLTPWIFPPHLICLLLYEKVLVVVLNTRFLIFFSEHHFSKPFHCFILSSSSVSVPRCLSQAMDGSWLWMRKSMLCIRTRHGNLLLFLLANTHRLLLGI